MTHSPDCKNYTFKDGLASMAAKAVGIDPDLAVAAGEGARAAINALRKAMRAKNITDRTEFIRDAQAELKSINPLTHGKLVNAVQARILALQGRGEDTEVAHLTPGEIVLPRSLQTPALMAQIEAQAARQGIDARQFILGHPTNRVNPQTGQREFAGPCIPGPHQVCVYGGGVREISAPRSPFGRFSYIGSQDMYFNDRIQNELAGLSEEELVKRYGGQQEASLPKEPDKKLSPDDPRAQQLVFQLYGRLISGTIDSQDFLYAVNNAIIGNYLTVEDVKRAFRIFE
jgi:hypothetical protein